MQFQVNQRQKVLVSLPYSWIRGSSNVDVVRWLMENVKSLCIRLVVMWQKGIYYYNTYENHQISAVDMYVKIWIITN